MASAEKPVEKSAESAEDKAAAKATDKATDKATVKPKKTHVYVHFIPGKDAQIAGTPWIIHTINGCHRVGRVEFETVDGMTTAETAPVIDSAEAVCNCGVSNHHLAMHGIVRVETRKVPNVGKRVVGIIRRVDDEQEDGVEVNARFFREKIGSLTTQLKETQKESNTRAQRCERLDNQLNKVQTKLTEANKASATVDERMAALESSLTAATEKNFAKNREIARLQEQLRGGQAPCSSTPAALKSAESAADKTEVARVKKDCEAAKRELTRQRKASKQRVAELEGQLYRQAQACAACAACSGRSSASSSTEHSLPADPEAAAGEAPGDVVGQGESESVPAAKPLRADLAESNEPDLTISDLPGGSAPASPAVSPTKTPPMQAASGEQMEAVEAAEAPAATPRRVLALAAADYLGAAGEAPPLPPLELAGGAGHSPQAAAGARAAAAAGAGAALHVQAAAVHQTPFNRTMEQRVLLHKTQAIPLSGRSREPPQGSEHDDRRVVGDVLPPSEDSSEGSRRASSSGEPSSSHSGSDLDAGEGEAVPAPEPGRGQQHYRLRGNGAAGAALGGSVPYRSYNPHQPQRPLGHPGQARGYYSFQTRWPDDLPAAHPKALLPQMTGGGPLPLAVVSAQRASELARRVQPAAAVGEAWCEEVQVVAGGRVFLQRHRPSGGPGASLQAAHHAAGGGFAGRHHSARNAQGLGFKAGMPFKQPVKRPRGVPVR